MARAQGARAQMALATEMVYGVPPATGFVQMPFAGMSLGSEQPLIANDLLGYGRDPLAPEPDAITVDGDVTVPLEAETFGFWLFGAFGAPITTDNGDGTYTHEFRSGGWDLPSFAIERQLPDVPQFNMFAGCMVDTLAWQMQRGGNLTGTVSLVAQDEQTATTTAAGVLQQPDLSRFSNFQGEILRSGSVLGNVVSAEISYTNNLDRIETIRADGKIDGADPSIAAATGSITVRFADGVMYAQALANAPADFVFRYTKGNDQMVFTLHEVYLPRPRPSLDGPGGVEVSFDFQGALNAVATRMVTVALTNTRASYS